MSALVPILLSFASLASMASDPVLAAIRLYNPTAWAGPALVEVPVGRVAAPGLLDWKHHRLVLEDREIPFAIREGLAHWKAHLLAPIDAPRAEDLLVFWVSVPPGQGLEVKILPGLPAQASALENRDEKWIVRYPALEAEVDAHTGLLTALSSQGASLISGPLKISANALPEGAYTFTGNIGPGYVPHAVEIETGSPASIKAKLASASSTLAMTELNFLLEVAGGPQLGLTYRFHTGGLVEILSDGRPWEGDSPWLRHRVNVTLPLPGDPVALPYLENRFPFYGFKDFAASVKQVAHHYSAPSLAFVEIGEEVVNGRRWHRRLFPFAGNSEEDLAALIEIMDEGLVVDVLPMRTQPGSGTVGVVCAAQDRAIGDVLLRKLRLIGVNAAMANDADHGPSIRLSLEDTPSGNGVEGDGFEIREEQPGRVRITARTRLGLHQGATALTEHLRQHGIEAGWPLIARNPVVSVRGGGFGGGPFEVDLPYGTDEEWERAFESLIDSGMNIFWCLGMWGNWKTPVSYAYMPELRSGDPGAYDESSGVLFSELDTHREHGLKLMRFLQDRGARVYVWLPIGCVPTTFAEKFPDSMMPGSTQEFWGRPKGTPCFTHPAYRAYLDAFLKELIKVYPLDGIVLVRDDNGGVCTCENCTTFTAESRTKNAVWEQYLMIYDWLRAHHFDGAIGVYPYFDGFTPELDALMPEDLFVCGHGASTAVLTRPQTHIGHMPDTWLDNLYANFRLPPSARVRRLLSDRGSFWIGGAYHGTELPWEAIGYFGWEPTATVNTFRYQWGARTFGTEDSLAFVEMNDAYEDLWEINARYMIPNEWMKLAESRRERISQDAMNLLEGFHEKLAALKERAADAENADWFAMVSLFRVFFEYHLHRLNSFSAIYQLIQANRESIDGPDSLPEAVRTTVLARYAEIRAWAKRYDAALRETPGAMLEHTRNMTMPYKEWMAGYDGWLDPHLDRPQFAGTMTVEASGLKAGEPFALEVTLHNTGICPWMEDSGQHMALSGETEALGLPKTWMYTGEAMAPGDWRTIVIRGLAPHAPGPAKVELSFLNAFRVPGEIAGAEVMLVWN